MFKRRSAQFRPSIFDRLEDRAVPSRAVPSVEKAAAVTSTTTSDATKFATLESQLATAGTQINAAYGTFAASLQQAEVNLLLNSSVIGTVSTTAALESETTTLANTLAASVGTALSSVTNIGNRADIVASGLNGSGTGSLVNQLNSLFAAASTGNSIIESAEPLLFDSVLEVIGVSYGSTAIQGFLAGLAGSGLVPPSSSTATPFSATTFGTQANGAFSTFATSIRTAELTLPTTASTSTGTGTIASATTAVTAASDTLETALANSLTGTTAEAFAALGPIEEAGALAGVNEFLTLALPDGKVLEATIPLVLAAGEAAIDGAYQATSLQGYLVSTIALPVTT